MIQLNDDGLTLRDSREPSKSMVFLGNLPEACATSACHLCMVLLTAGVQPIWGVSGFLNRTRTSCLRGSLFELRIRHKLARRWVAETGMSTGTRTRLQALYLAVSMNWGCFLWVSFYYKPNSSGSVLEASIFGKLHFDSCHFVLFLFFFSEMPRTRLRQL